MAVDLVPWVRNHQPSLERCIGCGAKADHPARPQGLSQVVVRDVGGIRDGIDVLVAVCAYCAPDVQGWTHAWASDGAYRAQLRSARG
jgi:hypothetical protein